MMKCARLCSVAFGFRSNKTLEEYHHSFVGEIACGRWRIAQNKRYLWGTYFYWICDCNSMKEILEYTGIIHQLRRWSQEIFDYDFSIVHRPAKMMKMSMLTLVILTLLFIHILLLLIPCAIVML